MLVYVEEEHGAWFLYPVSRRLRKRYEKETGNESVIFQTDWDFPGLARTMGWNGKIGRERCDHSGTDGTVTCRACGKTAGDFIAAAQAYLNKIEGDHKRVDADAYFGW